jgi:hypothetical protein
VSVRSQVLDQRLPQLREQDSAPDCLAALQAEERAKEEAVGAPIDCAHAKEHARQAGQKRAAAWSAAR